MVLSKRERLIALTTLGAIGVLALDRLALEPLLAANDELNTQLNGVRKDLQDDNSKLEARRYRGHNWAQMQNNGLRRKDISEADSQMLNNIDNWAREAGMTLVSVKPDRTESVSVRVDKNKPEKKVFVKSSFRVNGTGGMSQISRFLWHVETAGIPASVGEVQITTRKEGTDELSVQVTISTLCLAPESDKDATGQAER